jgi:hypothetical protein
MTYTPISATYANPENTAAIVNTEEAGAVAVSAVDTPVEWQALLDSGVSIAPYVEPEPPSPPRDIYAELDDLEARVSALEAP